MNSVDLSHPAEDFKDARRRYFANFSLKYKSAFRPHWDEGQTIGSKKDPDVWRNVGEHCLVAGAFAELLAELMTLTPEQVRAVTTAAILHDWYKKHETLARKRAKTAEELRAIITAVGEEDQRKLREKGYSEDVLRIASADVPPSMEGAQTDEERIMWFVDAMLTDTMPVPIGQRFDDLESHPVRADANKAFSASFTDVYGVPLYTVQRHLGDKIGAYIAERIGYTGNVRELPNHLKERLLQRITGE